MATGDTIAGSVRVARFDAEGAEIPVAGPYSQNAVDGQLSLSEDQKLYINTSLSNRQSAPLQAREVAEPDAEFLAGEVIRVQHQANATVANDIDHDHADVAEISVLKEDKNRGTIRPDVLDASDQELSADVAEVSSGWATFYEFTVPDRMEYRLVGPFIATAIEN